MIGKANYLISGDNCMRETIPPRTFDVSRENEIIKLIEQYQR
jgi:hypothetical protein